MNSTSQPLGPLPLLERRLRRLSSRVREQAEQLAALRRRLRAELDSESAAIAILDGLGVVVDVNAQWRNLARSNGRLGESFGIGANYLALCEIGAADQQAGPDEVALAGTAKEAIEDVLAGRRHVAQFDYQCCGRGERRWFEMTVTPFGSAAERGAIVRHRDISEQTIVHRALRRQSDLIRAVDESLPVIMYERVFMGGEWDYRFSSDRFVEVFGMPPDGLWEPGAWADMLHADDRERVMRSYADMVASGGGIWRADFRSGTLARGTAWFRAIVNVDVRNGREVRSIGILQDVSSEKAVEERVDQVRDFDELTGLHSRTFFMRAIQGALEKWVRSGRKFALVLLDIDDFHEVNEVYGSAVGDALLVAFVKRVNDLAAGPESIGRLDGDKLGLIVDVRSVDEALAHAREFVWGLCGDYEVVGRKVALSVSSGVALPHSVRMSAGDLLHDANVALDLAFASGGASAQAFSAEMGVQNVARLTLKADLREALAAEQFELYYQQKVDLSSGRIVGCEALLRWNHPTLGVRSPGEFLAMAEQTGLVVPIGEWTIREACRQAVRWREAGVPPVPIAVNLSAVQFARTDVSEMLSRAIEETGAPRGSLDIEVTESAFIDVSEGLTASFRRIRDLGIEIALDDFGTGFSSLGYLKSLPLAVIKVDRSFVQGAIGNASDAAIVRCVVNFARELGLRVVAEGIETAEQLEFVRRAGCDEAQGYYFGRPVPAAAFRAMLEGEAAASRAVAIRRIS